MRDSDKSASAVSATRLGANAIVEWAKSELSGYREDAIVPPYTMTTTPVVGTFSGPMRSFIPMDLSSQQPRTGASRSFAQASIGRGHLSSPPVLAVAQPVGAAAPRRQSEPLLQN